MAASSIQGLQFSGAQPYMPNYGPIEGGQTPYAAYNRPGMAPAPYGGNNEITISWICGALAMTAVLGCGWIPFGGLAPVALAAIGMWQGGRARDLGHPQGQSAYVFSMIALILGILGLLICTSYVFAFL